MIKIRRVYEQAENDDGYRILIDRLWPRALTKENAKVELWLKEIAPSDELRKWFSHDPEKWDEFKIKYKAELKNKSEYLQKIKVIERNEKLVTLLYAAKDEKHNNVLVLKELLEMI